MVKAYGDWFSGYATDPEDYLKRTFEEVAGYDEMVVLRDIEFESHCEHHMAPIIGKAHVGYLPNGRCRRHQQARACGRGLRATLPGAGKDDRADRALHRGSVEAEAASAVVIVGAHECMTTRGIHKRGVSMVTSKMLGDFRDDARTRAEFLRFIDGSSGR